MEDNKNSKLPAWFSGRTKEIILYLIFGGLTTVISIAVYYIAFNYLHIHYLVSEGISWFLSVLFAYLTNRKWVFESKAAGFGPVMREALAFYAARGLTGLLGMGLLWLFVDVFGMGENIAKIVQSVVVIILNYVFSKLFVFRKKAE